MSHGWYPRYNSRGQIVSEGLGEVHVAGIGKLANGAAHDWLDDDHILVNAGDENSTLIIHVATGKVVHQFAPGFNWMAASQGRWIGVRPPDATFYTREQQTDFKSQTALPAFSPDGRWQAHVSPYTDEHKTVFLNGAAIAQGDIHSVSLSDTAAVWLAATGKYTRETWGMRYADRQPVNLSVLNWEGPQIADGPNGSWIVSVTQGGLLARPWGSTDGYFWHGEFFNPHARFFGGVLKVAYSTGRGELQELVIDTTNPRVPLLPLRDIWNVGLPAPQPEPTPIPPVVIPPVKEPPVAEPVSVPNLIGAVVTLWNDLDMFRRQADAWRTGGKPAIQRLQMHWFARLTVLIQAALPSGWRAMWEHYRNAVPGTEWFWLPDQFLLVDPNGFVHSVKVIAGADENMHHELDAFELVDGEKRYKWVLGVPTWNDLGIPGPENFTTSDPVHTPQPEKLGPSPFDSIPDRPTDPPVDPIDPVDPVDPPEPDYEAILEVILAKIGEVVEVEVAKVTAAFQAEIAALRAELDTIQFEGRNRLLGTITFSRKK